MPNRNENPDKMTGKLAQLAALQQIGQSGQAQQLQANDSRMRAAMGMLGLLQQGQQDEAQNAFRAQQLEQQKAAEANRQGEYWGGALPLQYTEQAGLEAHRKAQEEQANRAFADESGYRWGVQAPSVWDEEAKRKEALAQRDKEQLTNASLSVFDTYARLGDPRAQSYIPKELQAMDQQRHSGEVQQGIANPYNQQIVQKLKGDPTLLGSTPAFMQLHPDVQKGLLDWWHSQQAQTPAAVPPSMQQPQGGQPQGDINGARLLEMMLQQDPNMRRPWQKLQETHAPIGKGTAYEGSPMYNSKLKEYNNALDQKAAMLAPYLFQLIGKQPINPNEA